MVELCPQCGVGKLGPAGPPYTDSATKVKDLAELRVLYRCTECGYSEERSPEPPDESQRDRGEVM